MSNPPASNSRPRAWLPIGASAALHSLLLILAVGLSHRPAAEPRDALGREAQKTPRIDMIYVPVPEVAPPMPPPAPRPPPPAKRTGPEPEPNAPPEAIRSSGTEQPPTAEASGGEARGEANVSEAARTPEVAEVTLESEARRIFGRPRLAARPGVGPEAVRPMEAWVSDRPERCIPRPSVPRDSAGPVQLGMVSGRIFRQDTGQPVAGAHLQMVGTPYVTFTDGRGEYRFRFDVALADNCRTQYVRVSADGYESRLLVLVLGPNRSDDVRLRRR